MSGRARKTIRLEISKAGVWENKVKWFALGLLTAIAIIAIVANLSEFSPRRTGESARFYPGLPGIDLASVAPERRPALLEEANRDRCTCGCKMTLAYCRNNDRSCRTSLRLCQEMVQRFSQPEKTDDK